jgi:peptidoglycan hydrolase CwlO-like protein
MCQGLIDSFCVVLWCAVLHVCVQTGEGLVEQLEKQGELLSTAQQQLKDQQTAAEAAEQSHADAQQQLEQQLLEAQQQLQARMDEVGLSLAGQD